MGADELEPDRPPEPMAGDVVAAPDFVGIGVQKAGTTWWYDLIAEHPGVWHRPGRPKELHYFDRFWAEPLEQRHVQTYHRWFARPEGQLAGEWTPRYLHDWWVPSLLFGDAAPAAKALVLLRDPFERYRSGVAHELRSRRRRDPAIAGDALARSCYAAQLERLHEVIDPAQVLVLQFERCVRDPAAQLRRTYEFLGLDPSFEPAELERPRNVTDEVVPELSEHARAQLGERLAADLDRLFELVPELDPQLWPCINGDAAPGDLSAALR